MDLEIVRSAYRKLKSYIYHDNSNLLLRRQLANFESDGDIDIKLDQLSEKLSNFKASDRYWKSKFSKINSFKVVKQFEPEKNGTGVISNLKNIDDLKVDRLNHFINCPFELHICAAIWTFEIGYKLELLMGEKPYGNKFDLVKDGGEDKVAEGLKSYKPYFGQYQKWRDGAVQSAKDIVDRERNALIIGLDVKDFYHSVRLDIKLVYKDVFSGETPEEYKSICKVFTKILARYSKYIGVEDARGRCILPIGIISSGVLSNYYLDQLDSKLCSKLRPDFYGRYVDDILLVTSCPEDQDVSSLSTIADQYLVETEVFTKEDETDLYSMADEGYESIKIQSEKLSVLHFSSSEPAALLDKFLAEIKKNSSEYRLLPEDEVVDYDFNKSAYNLNYSGAGNKLRDIKEFGEDKFGISKYLAKKIFIALQSGHEPDMEAVQKIVKFFKGRCAVELYSLWEKVFTFLLVNKAHKEIFSVVQEILMGIGKIRKGKADDWDGNNYYIEHLFSSLSMAFSLKPSVIGDTKFISRLESVLSDTSLWENYDFNESIDYLRKANLIRHNYCVHPLLNYAGRNKSGSFYDLIDYEQYFQVEKDSLNIHPDMYKYSPRFVHFYEVTLFYVIDRISKGKSKFYQPTFHFASQATKSSKDYLDDAAETFYQLNFTRNNKLITKSDNEFKEVKRRLYKLEEAKSSNKWIRSVSVSDDRVVNKLKVGIVNMPISREVFEHPYLRKPIIKPVRRKLFNSILNQAENEDVDLLVLPEVSVPVSWFKWIADHALRQQRGMVFGLEHWVVGNRAFNFIVTLMPFTFDGFKSLTVSIRLKNHYSPGEIDLLDGYGYTIPEVKHPSYDLFNWRGCHFTAFNCFELSNIEHRARFRSKIDLLVASEFNRDISYFSNLVESSARDIHCYVAQANDSKYGDSRVTQPTSANEKDLIKVKGGKNPVILVDTIDLNKLREFQLKEYSGQKALGTFKPTPPDFEKQEALKRMKR